MTSITVGYNHRAWATFWVKDATAEEIESLPEDGEELVTILQEWDAAGRLDHEGTQFDDNPEFFVDYVEPALVGSEVDRFTQVKRPILVYAFHTTDSGGGFNWAPHTDENYEALRNALEFDRDARNYETGTLVSLSVASTLEDLDEVTMFFEWALADAIEVGTVGHIIARYSLSPIDDSPCLALGRHYMLQRHSRRQCPAEKENQ